MSELVYGVHAVEVLLKRNSSSVQCLYVQRNRHDQRAHKLVKLAQASDIPVVQKDREELDEMTQQRHQGVIAQCNQLKEKQYHEKHIPEILDALDKAPFILMQDSIKIMIREKIKGSIVNILSMAMHSGHPFLAAYSASKAALANITKNTANAVAGHNIRVNALNIGWTDTPGEDAIQKKFHEGGDDWLQKAEKKVPFKRLTKALDVARAAAYFCSDESGLTTGSIIDYDQTVLGWHSYSAYDTNILDDTLLGE